MSKQQIRIGQTDFFFGVCWTAGICKRFREYALNLLIVLSVMLQFWLWPGSKRSPSQNFLRFRKTLYNKSLYEQSSAPFQCESFANLMWLKGLKRRLWETKTDQWRWSGRNPSLISWASAWKCSHQSLCDMYQLFIVFFSCFVGCSLHFGFLLTLKVSQRPCVIFPVRTSSPSAPQLLEIRPCWQFVVLNIYICI